MNEFRKIKFENGLRLVTVRDKSSQAITVLVLVATGSKYEEKRTNGISHLLEHMFFKGTKKRPTPIDVAEPLDNVGGAYNAFTGEEYTGYYAKVSAEKFDLALDVISDIYLNSKLDENELKKEKGVVIEEINMYNDNPASLVQLLWNKVLFGDQPAGWDIAGRKESVLGISRSDVFNYMHSQYVAPNTVVCIAGDLASDKLLLEKVKKAFKVIKSAEPKGKVPVIEKQTKPEALIFNKKTDQTHFCLGARGVSLFDPKRYTQDILALILGGMMSSRLFVKIREELGLAYYIRTQSSSDTDTGCIVTQTGADNSRAEEAIVAILGEYKKIAQNPVPLKELKKAKENLKGKMNLMLETSDAQASFYGMQELLENRLLTVNEIYDKINKVKASDVLNLAKEMFRPEKINLALVGPFEGKEHFEKLLWKIN